MPAVTDYAAARALTDTEFIKLCEGAPASARSELALLADHRRALRSPRTLSEWISKGRELQAPHLDLIDQAFADLAADRAERVGLHMPPRHGKQVADSEPVLTTEGWKRHGDLQVGDHVYAPTGKPIQVEWVSEPSNEKVRVTFSDGESVLVHPNHEWTVYDRSYGEWRTVETRYLATQKLHSGPQGRRGGRFRFQLPSVEPLQNQDADLPLDPYTLGVWLGDGTTGKASFCGTKEDVNHIASRIPYEMGARWVHRDTGVHYQYVKGIRAYLVAHGSKHIPTEYLTASERQRRELLAGLVDTDGSLGRDGRVRFVSASKELADGVRDLARTLGYRANITCCDPDERERSIWGDHPLNGGACWVVDWTPHDGIPQGTLPRKAVTHATKVKRRIGFATIEDAAPEPGRCIQVEGGLYLVGRALIPTHNSRRVRWAALWWLALNPGKRIMIATYGQTLSDAHGRWLRDTIEANSDLLGIHLKASSRASNRWDVDGTEGGLIATSVGGAATGLGADLLIVDDPVRDAKDAESLLMQERTWDWWQAVAQTRLEPGGKAILIQTRWSPGDLGGRILTDEPERWHTVDLPATVPTADEYAALDLTPAPDPLGRQPGEALWPDRYPADELAKIRRSVGERVYWALYQQQPRPPSGALLSRSNMDQARVPYAPDAVRPAVAVDPSGGGRDTAGIIGGWLGVDGNIYFTHDRSGRMSSDKWAEEACLLAHEIGADNIIVEKNFGGDMPKRLLYTAWEALKRTGAVDGVTPNVREVSARRGKFLRAEPIGQQIRNGKIRVVAGMPKLEHEWVSWTPEMTMSPGRIDASTYLAYHLLPPADGPARAHNPARPTQDAPRAASPWSTPIGR